MGIALTTADCGQRRLGTEADMRRLLSFVVTLVLLTVFAGTGPTTVALAGDTDLRNASVADLERMLAEALREDGMPDDSRASSPTIPEPSRERDRP